MYTIITALKFSLEISALAFYQLFTHINITWAVISITHFHSIFNFQFNLVYQSFSSSLYSHLLHCQAWVSFLLRLIYCSHNPVTPVELL